MLGHGTYFSEQEMIVSKDDKNIITKVLADSYCLSILENTRDTPKSCIEISRECKIPISTVYRRVQILHDGNFLQISGSISADGKKFFLYKSKVQQISATFDGTLKVEILPMIK